MKEKEQSEIKLSIKEIGEAYWIASSYQRAIRKVLEGYDREDLLNEDHYATSVIKLRQDLPMAWVVINSEASIIRRKDLQDKARQIGESDPSFSEKSGDERLMIAREALIDEFFEVSQKAPVSLRALQSILSSDVEESGRKAKKR